MTTQEFSNEFDTLLNSYSPGASIVLDEYEKSMFLTQAQEQLVLAYYTGKNSSLDFFEKTEEIRRYLSSLVMTAELTPNTAYAGVKLDQNSQVFSLPHNLWFITYESAIVESPGDSCMDNKELIIVPVTQDDFYRVRENPFKGPNSRRALRLDIANNRVEIVSKYTLSKYLIRYIEKLSPIILETMPASGDTSLNNNQKDAATCKLHESLHRPILELAVRLAIQSKGIGLSNNNN